MCCTSGLNPRYDIVLLNIYQHDLGKVDKGKKLGVRLKIRNLVIKNYRGIRELDWTLPLGDIYCLIGKGDSSKSTILSAIKSVFYPHWNLSMSDSDFYMCNTSEPIVIEATIGDLLNEFYSMDKYGLHLRGWNINGLVIEDEPNTSIENVLTIRLVIEADLEPKWTVVSDRNPDGVPFKLADRVKVNVGVIGEFSERELSWAAGTALTKITETQNINALLSDATRAARSSIDENRTTTLNNFDVAAQVAETVAKQLGVPVNNSYKAHLDLNNIRLKAGGLSLHDGEIPLRQLGLGSRRMLLCGIQKQRLEEGHITLFDEVEVGLEPFRIARLIKHINEDKRGQYFLTTHSPTVLRELSFEQLFIIHNKNGSVKVVAASDKLFKDYEIQGKIRSSAEVFLSKKVIICEGATEVGFLRGYENLKVANNKDPLSYHGTSLLDVRGAKNITGMAKALKLLCYDVAVLADADSPENFSPKNEQELLSLGICVQVWADSLALEERVIMDIPWQDVKKSVRLAETDFQVRDQVHSSLKKTLDANIENWPDTPKIRVALGNAAKKGSWYKSTTKGEEWFNTISSIFDDVEFQKTDLATGLNTLWSWVENA